ncbi:DNA-3-methyladenine glycosylase I [Erwinia tasmaniensis]|uniref:DNA-3-methyladenine glycosylase I n=1 Tax=Erwinia tasmaniensis (strain DSM 17950 / CFBP 7177 / CIP 109463 / NCPPB 4357 / Et1/99) TaxID=465817 RepID=B2VCG0_ERWT9|nr:DNA-3-methyladenine glycosylase I [Erwinia tasmaniensis]CAO98481.1 DNA-3-methyladenine glycosylase I [Erwinia tasmaniensis Et1/99]
MQRCGWVSDDPLYIAYHDNEWGVPHTDRQALFEMICLEGQVAGLSWLTVLKKREHYRRLFHHFDVQAVAKMDEADIDRLMQERAIIRHRGKISAIIANARALLAMEAAGEPFTAFIWGFVDHQPQIGRFNDAHSTPTTSAASDAMSKALKKRGFKFVGSVTCYSFMQACGLLCEHVTGCFCHPDNKSRLW